MRSGWRLGLHSWCCEVVIPGTIYRLFDPEPFRFKDYIASPKANGNQSIHTRVRDRDEFVFELQIRSVEMHRAAEEGNAAHWRYRAGRPR